MPPISSIEAWLHEVSDTSSLERRHCLSTPPSPPQSPLPSRKAKRRHSMDDSDTIDLDQTPKASKRKCVSHTAQHPSPSPSSSASQPPKSKKSRTQSQSDTSTNKTKQSGTSVKGLSDLYDKGVKYLRLEDVEDVLESVGRLCRSLDEYEYSHGVIPHELQPAIQKRNERPKIRGFHFVNAPDARELFDVQRELADITDIRKTSLEYESAEFPEPNWNDRVHAQVMNVALRDYETVTWQNITLARIYPKDLIPRDCLGAFVEAKMVDYAVILNPSLSLSLRLDDLLAAEACLHPATASRTINHTAHATLRRKPIALSVETKTPAANKHEAKGQLGVWAAAHLERLERLRQDLPFQSRDALPLPTLPLVLVHGTEWELFFANRTEGVTKVIGSYDLGSTKSMIGIYRLVRSIRALVAWIEQELLEWWGRMAESYSSGRGLAAGGGVDGRQRAALVNGTVDGAVQEISSPDVSSSGTNCSM